LVLAAGLAVFAAAAFELFLEDLCAFFECLLALAWVAPLAEVGVTLVVTVVVALAFPDLVVIVLVLVELGAASTGLASSPRAAAEAIRDFMIFLLKSPSKRRGAGAPRRSQLSTRWPDR
jgi:hypothetical protein